MHTLSRRRGAAVYRDGVPDVADHPAEQAVPAADLSLRSDLAPPSDLVLDEQMCFDLYLASRTVTAFYRPLLEELGLTYPQYLRHRVAAAAPARGARAALAHPAQRG